MLYKHNDPGMMLGQSSGRVCSAVLQRQEQT